MNGVLAMTHAPIAFPRPLVALAALTLLAGCEASTAPVTESTRPVQVTRATFTAREAPRELVGVVRARYETDLAFRVAGKVVARPVNVGDSVRAGDVIARIDPADLELQVATAAAELAAATSSLAQAAADLERYSTLRSRGYASVADFERKKAANDEAQGRLDRARRALELARNQRGYADLTADADGVITATPAEPGQVVAVGQAVARLARRGEKEAMVALPESFLAQARASRANVRLWADPQRSFEAQLRELSPQADPATRTYAARFTIVQPDETVALGMTATVTLAPQHATPVAKLPLAAVLNRGSGPSVYVVEGTGTLALRPVQVAAFTQETAWITAGIDEGERVVTLGVQKLNAGDHVRAMVTP
jgi:RND family efflux transporter MFP subunit